MRIERDAANDLPVRGGLRAAGGTDAEVGLLGSARGLLVDPATAAPVSVRGDAAVRILLALSRLPSPGVATADALVGVAPVPQRTLHRVLSDLSRAGLVVGLRGPSGGYRLAWPARFITLADVIAAVDQSLADACGLTARSNRVQHPADPLAATWLQVQSQLRAVLESWTLAAALDADGT